MSVLLLTLPFLFLCGLFAAMGFGLALSGRRLSRPDGRSVTGWLAGLGLGAFLLVGLMVLLVVVRSKASMSTEVRVTPPASVSTPGPPAIPLNWQPQPPEPLPPPQVVMNAGVALAPFALLGLILACLLVGGAVLLAVRSQVFGFSRGSWGPVLVVGLVMLVGVASMMWLMAVPVRADAGPHVVAPTWARLVLLVGIVVVPLVVAGLAAVVFHALRPSVAKRTSGDWHQEVSLQIPAWRLGLNGLALAILPAGAVWGGSLLALQATPREAVDAFGKVVLGIPSAAEQVVQASQVGHTRRPAPTEDRTQSGELPAWIRTAEVHSGSRQRLVLASRLYSSVAEAEHELLQETVSLVRNDLRQHEPLAEQATLQEIPHNTLRTLVVTNQHTQSEETDFGNFAAPMQRIWWEVQIDDRTRGDLAKYVHHEVARNRLLVGVWALALATLLVGCYLALIQRRRLTSPELPASLMTA